MTVIAVRYMMPTWRRPLLFVRSRIVKIACFHAPCHASRESVTQRGHRTLHVHHKNHKNSQPQKLLRSFQELPSGVFLWSRMSRIGLLCGQAHNMFITKGCGSNLIKSQAFHEYLIGALDFFVSFFVKKKRKRALFEYQYIRLECTFSFKSTSNESRTLTTSQFRHYRVHNQQLNPDFLSSTFNISTFQPLSPNSAYKSGNIPARWFISSAQWVIRSMPRCFGRRMIFCKKLDTSAGNTPDLRN